MDKGGLINPNDWEQPVSTIYTISHITMDFKQPLYRIISHEYHENISQHHVGNTYIYHGSIQQTQNPVNLLYE